MRAGSRGDSRRFGGAFVQLGDMLAAARGMTCEAGRSNVQGGHAI